MGLFGVANGIEGDLRPGLPIQMTEVHDPVRLLLIIEQYPQIVMEAISQLQEVHEWYLNEWIHLVVFDPSSEKLYRFNDGQFSPYFPLHSVPVIDNVAQLIESSKENIQAHIIMNTQCLP
jgi:uncharacterized protein YbcC (UPF0753/DUF2309 family)